MLFEDLLLRRSFLFNKSSKTTVFSDIIRILLVNFTDPKTTKVHPDEL
ncbi:hypothetical protein [Aquimarina hainanensis]